MKPATARLLFLATLLLSVCLPLGAHVPVNEKPHLGLNTRETPSHRGFALSNSLNAPGLAESLCQTRVRSRCSAKERDDESNLDYFLARYYASSLGRFNSVDPMNAGATPALPQSWNGYSYVLNGPLSLIDPTGEVWVSLGGDYSWVDGDCPSGDAQCVSSLATVEQSGNVNVYAQDGSRHTLTPNENGVVSVLDLAAVPGSGIEVGPQNVVENYLSPETAAQFFNLSGDYQVAFQGDGPLVFTGGSAETGNPGVNPQTGRPVHSTHYRGENVDLRYMGPNGQNIRSATAAASADVARTRFIVGGVHAAITSDPQRFGSIVRGPGTLRAHRNHIHLIPFPGAGRRTR